MQAMIARSADRHEERPVEAVNANSKHTASPTEAADAREYSARQLQPGTYYWTQGLWHPMQQLTMSGGGGTHMAKMFIPGLTPQMVWTFRGANAPVQVRESQPFFCVGWILGGLHHEYSLERAAA
jgi:hypothetical protein